MTSGSKWWCRRSTFFVVLAAAVAGASCAGAAPGNNENASPATVQLVVGPGVVSVAAGEQAVVSVHLEASPGSTVLVAPDVAPRSPFRAAVVPSGPVARAGATPTKPRAKKKKRTTTTTKTTPDDASPFVSTAEGTSPDRDCASEPAAPSGMRTSLGDGVVKPPCSRIAWAQLLRRVDWVEAIVTLLRAPGFGPARRPPVP